MPLLKSARVDRTIDAPAPTEPRTGGRGPEQREPPGYGGGDSWNNNPPGRRGPHDRLKRYRMGIAIMLVTSLILFLGLVFEFFLRKYGARVDHVTGLVIHDWIPTAIPPLLWFNTAVLLVSSLTMEQARRAVFREPAVTEEWLGLGRSTIRTSLPWLIATLALGMSFIAGQVEAWRQLVESGAYLNSNPSSHSYYFLTGLHGLHLLGGIIVLLWVGIAYAIKRPLESRQIVVDVTSWYWHAIGVVWIGIFVLLKWFQ